MESPLTTRAALLQALRSGPGYGLELIRRVAAATSGRVRLSEARVYPTLKALERAGFVSASQAAPQGKRGGRERTTYALAPRGVDASYEERDVLRAMAGPERRPRRLSQRRNDLMARRLLEGAALSDAALSLRRARLAARRS